MNLEEDHNWHTKFLGLLFGNDVSTCQVCGHGLPDRFAICTYCTSNNVHRDSSPANACSSHVDFLDFTSVLALDDKTTSKSANDSNVDQFTLSDKCEHEPVQANDRSQLDIPYESGSYLCNECSFTCLDIEDYLNHGLNHQDDDSYCRLSSDDSESDIKYDKNLEEKKQTNIEIPPPTPASVINPSSLLSCPDCDFQSEKKTDIISHKLTHRKRHKSQCISCPKKFYPIPVLMENSNKKNVTNNDSNRNIFGCPDCDYQSNSQDEIINHKKTHNQSHLQCISCRKKSVSMQKRKSKRETTYRCEICDFKTSQQNTIYIHKLFHSEKKKFNCPYCEYKCVRQNEMIRHQRSHDELRRFECNICHAKFIERFNLENHKQIHALSNFSCDKCKFTCSTTKYLKKHQLTHEKTKKHTCDMCDFSSHYRRNLLFHLKTHTGSKPLNCDKCDFSCYINVQLKIHQRIHTNTRPFCCDMCEYSSTTGSALNRHKRTHLGSKPYSCDMGDYKSSQPGNLSRHKKTHTNGFKKK